MKKENNKMMIPYIGTIVGLVITIIATFIDYFKYSSLFYSRKYSIFDLFVETFKNTDSMLGTTDDIILFVLIILGIVFLVVSLILILLKKPKTFIFVIIAFLFWMFGTDGRAWLHFIGLGIALAFSIWYKISSKKSKKKPVATDN